MRSARILPEPIEPNSALPFTSLSRQIYYTVGQSGHLFLVYSLQKISGEQPYDLKTEPCVSRYSLPCSQR